MRIEQLISPSVPTLDPSDTGNRALDMMQENNITQLPMVAEDNFLALISETEVFDWSTPEAALSTSEFTNYKPAIRSGAHPFEAMRIMHEMNLVILPVIDLEQKYVGCVTKDSLLKYITENSSILTPGGIIVLEVAPRNYTLYEIARICENEDVTIMNMQVMVNELGMLEITLKLNRNSVDAVVSSFERHNYNVKEAYGESINDDDITGKYHLLMNYINM